MAASDLDLIVASTSEKVVMIEGFGSEIPDPEMGDAIMEAHRMNQEIIALQHELRLACGLPPYQAPEERPDTLSEELHNRYAGDLREAKQHRR